MSSKEAAAIAVPLRTAESVYSGILRLEFLWLLWRGWARCARQTCIKICPRGNESLGWRKCRWGSLTLLISVRDMVMLYSWFLLVLAIRVSSEGLKHRQRMSCLSDWLGSLLWGSRGICPRCKTTVSNVPTSSVSVSLGFQHSLRSFQLTDSQTSRRPSILLTCGEGRARVTSVSVGFVFTLTWWVAD